MQDSGDTRYLLSWFKAIVTTLCKWIPLHSSAFESLMKSVSLSLSLSKNSPKLKLGPNLYKHLIH